MAKHTEPFKVEAVIDRRAFLERDEGLIAMSDVEAIKYVHQQSARSQ
jgi:hypothetical protein